MATALGLLTRHTTCPSGRLHPKHCPPHWYTRPQAQNCEVTSLQMVGVRSQCGILRDQQPGLQTQLEHVLAVWPWAEPLSSLGLSCHTGLYFSAGRIRMCVISGKARPPIKRKPFFGEKLIFQEEIMRSSSVLSWAVL